MKHRLLRVISIPFLLAAFFLLSACEITEYGGSATTATPGVGSGEERPPGGDDPLLVNAGKAEYDAQCAGCHGAVGEGGIGGPINPESYSSLDELISINDLTMPPGLVENCSGDCASEVSKYIMAGFEEIAAEVPGNDNGGLIDLTNQGKAQYDQYCLACHGEQGDGLYPIDQARFGLDELIDYNERLMPPNPPEDCIGQCAIEVSRYILAGYNEVEAAPAPGGDVPGNPDQPQPGGQLVADAQAQQLYNENCSGCHGDQGDGIPALGAGPLKGAECVACANQSTLISTIDSSMPAGSASDCVGQCAEKTAAYILAGFVIDGGGSPITPPPPPPPPVDNGGNEPPVEEPPAQDSNFISDAQAKSYYDSLCASCHGASGEGGVGGALPVPAGRNYSNLAELAQYNDQSMPTISGSPSDCVGECAERTAAYIWAGFQVTDETFTP